MFPAITSCQGAGNGVTFPNFGYHLETTVAGSGEDELSESIGEIPHRFQAYEATLCKSV